MTATIARRSILVTMSAVRLLARSSLRATKPGSRLAHVVLARRHASFYNSDVAGLTEEQAEVCCKLRCTKWRSYRNVSSFVMLSASLHKRRWRLVQQRLTRQTPSPRYVYSYNCYTLVFMLCSGSLGKDGRHGATRYHCFPRVWRSFTRVF